MLRSVDKRSTIPSVAANTYANFATALEELSALTSDLRARTSEVIREDKLLAH